MGNYSTQHLSDLIRKYHKHFLTLITFILFGTAAFAWPTGVHDPSSIVKCNGKYWLFATGNGIHSLSSTDMVVWNNASSKPFSTTNFPSWITKYVSDFAGNFWAPDIIYMNNKYYLYYSCSSWGTMSSCIGVVVNETLDPTAPNYEWKDQGDIGIWSSGGDVNAIDPAVMKDPYGRIWLTYGSFNKGGIMVTEVDSISGKPKNTNRYSVANSWTGPNEWSYAEGEGGCMFYNDGYYYMVYNKGGCCAGVSSSYYMVIGRSIYPTGPFYDKNRKPLKAIGKPSGGTILMKHDDSRGYDDRFYGPGHFGLFRENGNDYVTFHYYDPNGPYPDQPAGAPRLGIGKLKWGEDGWPTLSMDFLDKGFYTLKNANSLKVIDIENHSTASGNSLYQYIPSNTNTTQKWRFTPLGTGEYKIQNYADSTLYVEATGTNNDTELGVTNSYTGAVNQKFRVIKSSNGDILIYPSISDKVVEVPNALKTDSPLGLWGNNESLCQRWQATSFVENFTISQTEATIDYTNADLRGISISCNGSWELSVGDNSWLTVSPTSGTGATRYLTITPTENSADTSRTNKIFVTTLGGVRDTITITQHAYGVTSIGTVLKPQANITPNPTNGVIEVISVSGDLLEIFNNAGIKILNTNLTNTKTNLDISNLENGIYIFKITNNEGTSIQKVIKK